MKLALFLIMVIPGILFASDEVSKIVIPIKDIGVKSSVSIRVGDLVIPDILLDTGFGSDGVMIYNPDYRTRLDQNNAVEYQVHGAGSGEGQKVACLESVDIGISEVILKNQKLLILQSDIYKGFPSNGIIGYSIFGHYITEFNYDQNTMALYRDNSIQIDSTWTKIPLSIKDNHVPWIEGYVAVTTESPVLMSMYIDYAAGDAILILEKADMKVQMPPNTVAVNLGRGLSGDIYGKTGIISSLKIGPYELKNVKASFAPAEIRSKQPGADAIIGITALRRFNLIFDYAGNTLYLKPNSHFNDVFE